VYKHTNTISRKAYIGYTKKTMKQRWSDHLYRSRKYSFDRKFDNALREYPMNLWENEILFSDIKTLEKVKKLEIEMISKYDTFNNGYNSNPGGGGHIHSKETNLKISNSKKGHSYNLGSKRSEETKKKMSLSKLGNKNCLGRILSKKTKKQISVSEKKTKGEKRVSILY
jgi:group I intron endonuclease